jgi:hypothetical protein
MVKLLQDLAPYNLVTAVFSCFSIPSNAMLDRRGDITPP